MQTADRIHRQVQSLPEPVQREVLDFVEFLAHRLRQEEMRWADLSMRAALRGMEDEVWPEYREEHFKEKWWKGSTR